MRLVCFTGEHSAYVTPVPWQGSPVPPGRGEGDHS